MSTSNVMFTPSEPSLLDQLRGAPKEEANALHNLLIEMADILPCLDRGTTHMHSFGQKKPMPLCKITCENWKSAPALKTKTSYIVPDPTRFFTVHIAVGTKILKGVLTVFIEYEPIPFVPLTQFKALADDYTVQQFHLRRAEFKGAFGLECGRLVIEGRLPVIKMTNHCTRVGSIDYNLTGKSLSEVAAWLGPIVDDLACAISASLHEVEMRHRNQVSAAAPTTEPLGFSLAAEMGPDEVPFPEQNAEIELPVTNALAETEEGSAVATEPSGVSGNSGDDDEKPAPETNESATDPITN
jgi:hypothetical protein